MSTPEYHRALYPLPQLVGAFVERFDEQLDNFNLNLKAFHGTPRRVLCFR